MQGFIQVGGLYFLAGETMWLIDHSEGEGVGGGGGGGVCSLPCCGAAETYCLIYILSDLHCGPIRVIMSATGTAT